MVAKDFFDVSGGIARFQLTGRGPCRVFTLPAPAPSPHLSPIAQIDPSSCKQADFTVADTGSLIDVRASHGRLKVTDADGNTARLKQRDEERVTRRGLGKPKRFVDCIWRQRPGFCLPFPQ